MTIPMFQIRKRVSEDAVVDYAAKMQDGIDLGPIHVWDMGTGEKYAILDGFTRWAAANRADVSELDAIVHRGSKDEAERWVLQQANIHGAKLTPDEQVEKVRRYKKLMGRKLRSVRQAAKDCNVSRYIATKALGEDEPPDPVKSNGTHAAAKAHPGRGVDDGGGVQAESAAPVRPALQRLAHELTDDDLDEIAADQPVTKSVRLIRMSRDATAQAVKALREAESNLTLIGSDCYAQASQLGASVLRKYSARILEMIDNLQVTQHVGVCHHCKGDGKPGCKLCGGSGVVTKAQLNGMSEKEQKAVETITKELAGG